MISDDLKLPSIHNTALCVAVLSVTSSKTRKKDTPGYMESVTQDCQVQNLVLKKHTPEPAITSGVQ